MKPVLGLLGGIGSGKSLVADELVKQGGFLIPADQLGHEALLEPTTRKKVIERFGQEITDNQGNIDRRKLGQKVFTDKRELQALESLVFPFIERRIQEEIELARQEEDAAFIVLDAAIMLEAGWNHACDRLIFVDAPRQIRLERLARQRNWQEKEVTAREQMQMPLSEKKQRADWVVNNAAGPEEVVIQVRDFLKLLGIHPENPNRHDDSISSV